MRGRTRVERRVVVTGLGLVTPLATGVGRSWERLLRGDTAVARCTRLPPERLARLPCQIAAEVSRGSGEGEFDLERWVPPELRRHTRPFVHYALAAGAEALADAGWDSSDGSAEGLRRGDRAGVSVGTGMVDLEAVGEAQERLAKSYRKLSPFFIPSILGNMPAGHLSIQHGLRGPNHAPTTACTTGAHAIGDAANFIRYGSADMMLAGATEASIHELALAGFGRAQALATGYNGSSTAYEQDFDGDITSVCQPWEASRPFSAGRSGFVMGEGAGMMVLEDYDCAIRRGVTDDEIYAEFRGYGSSGDAFHITSPASDGSGAMRAMEAALKDGGVASDDVDYVNAHGAIATSTPIGDVLECGAIGRVFGGGGNGEGGSGRGEAANGPVAVSSTKGAVGHLLGAAGAVEAVFTVLALKHQRLPPTVNLTSDDVDPAMGIDPDVIRLVMADGKDPAVSSDKSAYDSISQGLMPAFSAAIWSQLHFIVNFAEDKRRQVAVRAALTNSFGFGGTNASLLFTLMGSDL